MQTHEISTTFLSRANSEREVTPVVQDRRQTTSNTRLVKFKITVEPKVIKCFC